MKKIDDKLRRYNLDLLRIIAISAVVVIHCIAVVVTEKPIDSLSWSIGILVDSFMRWSVPVFVMISGALLINEKAFTKRDDFLKKRLSRIAVAIVAWPIIYMLWHALLSQSYPNIMELLIGYVTGSPIAPHLYFLFLIAGLYVLTPFVSLYAINVSRRQYLMTSLIILGVTTIWYTIAILHSNSADLNVTTQWVPYVGYFMLGCALKDVKIKRKALPFIVFIASGIVMATATYFTAARFGINSKGLFFYPYVSILSIIMAISAYLSGYVLYDQLTSSRTLREKTRMDSILRKLSGLTFCVYLIHFIVMDLASRLLIINDGSLKHAASLTLVTLTLSFALSFILVRIPKLKLIVT
jgi:surface polysaccharide O-acyltransferase-like enzyme